MTSPDPLAPGDAAAPDFFATALLNLRDTVKWMIAAAVAMVAILVTGLQIKELGNLAGSPLTLAAAAAAGATLVALLLVLFVVAAAVRVLSAPRLSVRDLSVRELGAGASALQVRLEAVGGKLVQSLLEQRTYVLGRYESINEFYCEHVAMSLHRPCPRRGSYSLSTTCVLSRQAILMAFKASP